MGIIVPLMADRHPYVIVGRGYAAALNYTTLRLTDYGRARLGGRDVTFIGSPDPWQLYHPHLMGQGAMLLSLPGFLRYPHGENFLLSTEFAAITDDQYAFLGSDPKVRIDTRMIEKIGRDDTGEDLWLRTVDGAMIYAAKVDICTGPGAPTPNPFGILEPVRAELIDAARLFSGEEFLHNDTIPGRGTICIVGAGPVGALCCERALSNNNRVLWVGLDDFSNAFPPGGRFDSLGHRTASGPRPRLPGLQIAPFCRSCFKELDGEKPRMGFHDARDKSRLAWGWDQAENGMLLDELTVDCLVFAFGPSNGLDALFARSDGGGVIDDWDIIGSDALSIPVALQRFGGDLRVLGAAALSHWWFRRLFDPPHGSVFSSLLNGYVSSLSDQVQVPDGNPNLSVPVAARFIGEANKYFSENAHVRGPNWNCAFSRNIEACLERQGFTTGNGALDQSLEELFALRRAAVLRSPPAFAPGYGGVVYSAHDYGPSQAVGA